MDRELCLYRLVRTLVPDQNTADNIFLRVRDEADLRRRVNHLRGDINLSETNGVEVRLNDMDLQHARHMIIRRRLRKRLFLALVGALITLVVVQTIQLVQQMRGSVVQLNHYFYSRDPLATHDWASGGRFAVYKLEVTPTNVIMWWEMITDRRATDLPSPSPEIRLIGTSNSWIKPTRSEVINSRTNRIIARSVYEKGNHFKYQRVFVRMLHPQDDREAVVFVPSITYSLEDDTVRDFPVGRTLAVRGADLTVEGLTIAKEWTELRFRTENLTITPVGLEVDSVWLSFRGEWGNDDGDIRTFLFEPAPDKPKSATVYFPPFAVTRVGTYVIPVHVDSKLRDVAPFRTGFQVSSEVELAKVAAFLDSQGNEYRASTQSSNMPTSGYYKYVEIRGYVPNGVKITSAWVTVDKPSATTPLTIEIDLGDRLVAP